MCRLYDLPETCKRSPSIRRGMEGTFHSARLHQRIQVHICQGRLRRPPRAQAMGPCHRTHSVVEPKSSKVYPLSPVEQKELDSFLEENLCTGRVCPSKSPMAAPVFFIKKKDGSLQLVQDYRALNSMTVKNKYPLPLISELVSQLHRARYFTKLDVHWGFNNVRIKPRDE